MFIALKVPQKQTPFGGADFKLRLARLASFRSSERSRWDLCLSGSISISSLTG
jgi:hypothetical protein